MRIERAGNERWLVVDRPPDAIWPVLREFWQEQGFVINIELPAEGIMETDWAENRAKIPQDVIRRTLGKVIDQLYSTGERDKFRTRLETGSGGTEVYISHRGMVEVLVSFTGTGDKDTTVWQPRPSDPELEAEFLRRLMLKLGGDQQKVDAMVAASGQPGAPIAQLVRTADQGASLEIRESFDRAWRRVGLALDRGGFTVEDRDRSQGIYFVRYIDPETAKAAKEGFFSKLFSSSKPKPTEQYRVVLVAQENATRVTVATKDGKALESEGDRKTGAQILALLREQMQQ
jgi:outer membrane protein assembly factor BamC